MSELKEGDIVYEERGMPIFRRGAEEDEYEEREEEPEPEEEDLLVDLEEVGEGAEEEQPEERVAEDEDVEERIEEEPLEEEEEERIEEPPTEKEKRPQYETVDDLEYQKVEYSEKYREFADLYGLPKYEYRLLPMPIKRRIHRYQVMFPAYQRMRVGANGELLPDVSPPHKIRHFDDIRLPKERLIQYKPEIEIKENPYDARFKIGSYVKFTDQVPGEEPVGIPTWVTDPNTGRRVMRAREKTKALQLEGVVIEFDDKTATVSVAGRYHTVNYDALELTHPPSKKVEEVIKSTPDIRGFRTIPNEIRDSVIASYVSILGGLLGGILGAPTAAPSKPETIRRELVQNHAIITWDHYYSVEFQKWIKTKYNDKIYDELDTAKLMEVATQIAASMGPATIVQEIFEGLSVDATTTVEQLLNLLRAERDITALQADMIRVLNREVLEGNGNYHGKSLAAIISNAVENYMRYHPVDLQAIYNILVNAEMSTRFEDLEPTDEDCKEFEDTYLGDLSYIWTEHAEQNQAEKEKILEPKSESTAGVGAGEASIKASVESYERIVFAGAGSLYEYLLEILTPYIFLEGPLARHANFFREKVKSDKFQVEAFAAANLAHFLPELTMNKSLPSDKWEGALAIIQTIKELEANAILRIYTGSINPTARLPTLLGQPNPFRLAETLAKMLKDPREMCEPVGERPVVKDGRYVYYPGTRDLMMEKIPLGDMVICYSDAKFTCHDSAALVREFAAGKTTNPFTGKEYPSEFIERIVKRYKPLPEPEEALFEEVKEENEGIREHIERMKRETAELRAKRPTKVVAKKKKIGPQKPLRKKTGKIVETLGLIGELFDVITLWSGEVTLKAVDGTDRVVDVRNDRGDVVLLGFDAIPTVSEAQTEVKKFSKSKVYIVVYANTSVKEKAAIKKRIKGADKKIIDVYFVDERDDESELVSVIQTAVNSVEGGIQPQ